MDVISVDDCMMEDLDTRDRCRKLRRSISACLSDREAKIIALRYGLNNQAPKTQREIAALCGISRSYVSRIEKRALKKLEESMESALPARAE
jgi:RNA polymerase sporulation-specific sigma factor